MKYLMTALTLLLAAPAVAQSPEPKTIELPAFLVQRIMQVLAIEGGTTAAILLRGIDDCLKNQTSTQMRVTGQGDNCPLVTEALAARAKPDKAP